MSRLRTMIAPMLLGAACLSTACSPLAWAEPSTPQAPASTPAPTTDQQTITAEVVDPSSYLQEGRHGAELSEQTYSAVDGGQTLALLENGTGNLYLLLAEQAGEDPNELAYDYVNQQVKAQGKVYERGGVRGFVATSIELVAPAAPTPAAASTPAPEDKPTAN